MCQVSVFLQVKPRPHTSPELWGLTVGLALQGSGVYGHRQESFLRYAVVAMHDGKSYFVREQPCGPQIEALCAFLSPLRLPQSIKRNFLSSSAWVWWFLFSTGLGPDVHCM